MKIQKCLKKSHHFLTLWPWPLTFDLEKIIRSGHYHYQCVYQIWEQSIPWFLSYRVNTIAGGGRLRRKTITSPDPSDIIKCIEKTSTSLVGSCPMVMMNEKLWLPQGVGPYFLAEWPPHRANDHDIAHLLAKMIPINLIWSESDQ